MRRAAEQDPVRQREYRRVDANPQRQYGDGERGEAGVLPELTKCRRMSPSTSSTHRHPLRNRYRQFRGRGD